MAYIGKEPIVGNFQKCDAISVVNGQAAYTLQVSSTNVVPESANHMLVSLNGILQAPVTSFTVSGSTLTFASNLATGDVIDFVILLGNVLDLGVPSDDTVGAAQIKDDLISGTTALASEPADTDELLVSDAGVLKRVDYSYLKGGDNTPAFMAVMGSDDSLANSTFTKATFDNEVFDTDSAFASNKFTVPAGEGGKYVIFGHILAYEIDDTNRVEGRIYKYGANSGGASTGSQTVRWYSGGANFQMDMGFNTILDLNATDYIELYVNQTNGDSQTLYRDTWLAGFKLNGV